MRDRPVSAAMRRFALAAASGGLAWYPACTESPPAGGNPPAVSEAPTFARDIAPIVFDHCAACHRPGEAAPFSLLTYRDVSKRARQIAMVTESRFMPPWLPDPGHGRFAGERRLSEDEIATIRRWVKQGTVEGDPVHLPPTPSFPEGWQLGEPDLVIAMSEVYTLKAEGQDVFRCFVLPVDFSETRYVRAVEIRPSNRQVVHHANLFIDRTPESRKRDEADRVPGFDGMEMRTARFPDGHVLGWALGKMPHAGFDDIAWRLEDGTDLVLLLHLLPSGKPEPVQASIGLFFADEPPRRLLASIHLGSKTIDIPAGSKDYAIEDSFELPVDLEVLGVYPHAHYLGHEMSARATLPDGRKESLLRISSWDFNWQDEYWYAEPIQLPRGTVLWMRYTYDNSTDNVFNPNQPPKRVRYGPQSADEMGELLLQVMPRNRADLQVLQQEQTRRTVVKDIAYHQRLVQEDPTDPEARVALAQLYAWAGDGPKAFSHLEEALRIQPNNAEAHLNLGALLYSRGDVDKALEHIRLALETDPEFVKAHNNAGVALRSKGMLDEAIDAFRRALDIDPENDEAHANLGKALRDQGDLEGAAAHFRYALRTNSASIEAHIDLGALLQRQGKLDEAIDHFRRALETDPRSSNAHVNLGIALRAQGRLDEAIGHLRRAQQLDPSRAETHYNLGNALAARNEWDEAIHCFSLAVQSRPDFAQAHYNLGLAMVSLGRLDESVGHLRRALEADHAYAAAHSNLGRVLLTMGRPDEALVHFGSAIRLDPTEPTSLNGLAWILATHPDQSVRQPARAVELAELAAQLSGHRSAAILDTLAAAYASSGQFKEAVATAEAALELASGARQARLAESIRRRIGLYRQMQPYSLGRD